MAAGKASDPVAWLPGRRRTWIEIDLDALADNCRQLTRAIAKPLWCVVKADAYGHGALHCARTLADAGAHGLVVALPEEALALRRAGLNLPILLSGPLPGDGLHLLLENRVSASVSRLDDLQRLQEAARASGTRATFHLELDSGMHRMGLALADLESCLRELQRSPDCHLEAVLSHLASVEKPGNAAARSQLQAFQRAVARVRQVLDQPVPSHLASSPALCGFPEASCDMVRPGLLLYGVTPAPGLAPPATVQPVLSYRTTVALVRNLSPGQAVGYEGTWTSSSATCMAVISAGYADGLRRDLSGSGHALHRGQRLPFVGAVNMDLAQLDAGAAANIRPGDVVTLIGKDAGAEQTLEDLAACTGRTPYEWLTGLGPRIPRVYMQRGQPVAVTTPDNDLTLEC